MAGKLNTGPAPRVRREGQIVIRETAPAKKEMLISFDEDVDDPLEEVALAETPAFSKPATLVSVARGSVIVHHSNGVAENIPMDQFTKEFEFWATSLRMLAHDCKVDCRSLGWPGALDFDGERYSFRVDMSRDFPHKSLLDDDTLTVYGVLRS